MQPWDVKRWDHQTMKENEEREREKGKRRACRSFLGLVVDVFVSQSIRSTRTVNHTVSGVDVVHILEEAC